MKIYDCFTFFNELDLLKLRLEELYDHVDYFVLVEARQTHSGAQKKLYYEENKERYKKFNDKIIHVIVDLPKFSLIDKIFSELSKRGSSLAARLSMSLGFGNWKLERFQRKSIKYGLKNCKDDDIIMVSDLDEIPDPEKLEKAIQFARGGEIIGFRQKMFVYYLNGDVHRDAVSTIMSSYKTLKEKYKGNPQFLRIPYLIKRLSNKFSKRKSQSGNIWHTGYKIIEKGGWHFSYLGGAEKIAYKNRNFAHSENLSESKSTKEEEIEKDIREGSFRGDKVDYIKIDGSFPRTIQKNKKKYEHLIKDV